MPRWNTPMIENYTPVPESGCWLWLGNWSAWGYGQVKNNGKVVMGAHRYFYLHHKGEIPDGMLVCHKCDTRACVNPDHLFLGTDADNQKDRIAKGRFHAPNHFYKPERKVSATCVSCGAQFMAMRAAVNRGGGKVCSRACAAKKRNALAKSAGVAP